MFKKTCAAAIAIGLLGIQACTASTMDEETLEIGEVGQNLCDGSNINDEFAALAVAMATEIGELHPVRDLTISGGMVSLSSTGRSLCQARSGCNNIDALLSLQNAGVNSVIPTTVFDATNYRETLVASYQRQKDTDDNLARNNPGALPEPHRLVFAGTSNNGSCGPHYIFNAYKQNCTTGCDGLRAWDGGNWQFTVKQGETIKDAGGKYKANQDIGFANVDCKPSAPASWCASWFTKVGDCSDCQMEDPEDIVHRLAFFENGDNPYLAFFASNGQIGIDPTGTLNTSSTTSSGSCTAASMVYDPTYAMNNKCCSVNGQYGVFKPSYFNPAIFLCTI